MAEKSFDLIVHRRDKKGKIIHSSEYRREVKGNEVRYERPVGSGQWFYENGEPVEKRKAAVAQPKAPEAEIAAAVQASEEDLGIPTADELVSKAVHESNKHGRK